MLQNLLLEIKNNANKDKAINLSRFFQTHKGGYGEGDIFLGITVPAQRALAKKYKDLSLSDVETLLQSAIHEHRLIALFILRYQYKTSPSAVIDVYLRNLVYVNNWDLVDSSAPCLLGNYLLDKKRDVLYKLIKSKSVWDRRVGVMSTFAFIKVLQFEDALAISEILLKDKHDLIQKAVGWMLREIGNRNPAAEKLFLDKHRKSMPRTMLRYAIEKFDQVLKQHYLYQK